MMSGSSQLDDVNTRAVHLATCRTLVVNLCPNKSSHHPVATAALRILQSAPALRLVTAAAQRVMAAGSSYTLLVLDQQAGAQELVEQQLGAAGVGQDAALEGAQLVEVLLAAPPPLLLQAGKHGRTAAYGKQGGDRSAGASRTRRRPQPASQRCAHPDMQRPARQRTRCQHTRLLPSPARPRPAQHIRQPSPLALLASVMQMSTRYCIQNTFVAATWASQLFLVAFFMRRYVSACRRAGQQGHSAGQARAGRWLVVLSRQKGHAGS